MHLEFWFCTQHFSISTFEQTNKPRQAEELSRGKPRQAEASRGRSLPICWIPLVQNHDYWCQTMVFGYKHEKSCFCVFSLEKHGFLCVLIWNHDLLCFCFKSNILNTCDLLFNNIMLCITNQDLFVHWQFLVEHSQGCVLTACFWWDLPKERYSEGWGILISFDLSISLHDVCEFPRQ